MLWDYQASMGLMDAMPRRRAYSDSQTRRPQLVFNKQVSLPQGDQPPLIKDKGDAAAVSPASSGYGSDLLVQGDPKTPNRPIPGARATSPFHGLVVGSPLGQGPLNGSHVTNYSCITGSSPPPQTPEPRDDWTPMRRPRLSSLSEAPTVSSIPENLPMPPDPLPRPAYRVNHLLNQAHMSLIDEDEITKTHRRHPGVTQ
ncbi:unnamed protein product, partial [Meganyctiphanes norvegica]